MKFKHIWLIAAVFAAGLIASSVDSYFERAGWVVYDALQRAIPAKPDSQVAIIYVDQPSIDAIRAESGFSWPWPRHYYGAVARVAKYLRAKSVTFDIIFESPSTYGVDDDQAFNDELKKSGVPIVFPAPNRERTVNPPFERIAKGLENLHLGAVILPVESDGVYRRIPASIPGPETSAYRPLGLASLDESELTRISEGENLNWVHFYRNGTFPTQPFYNVIKGFRELEENRDVPAELKVLAGKHWFVGYRAPGLLDYKPTPTDPYAAGVEVHASHLANVLSNQKVLPAGRRSAFVTAVGVACIILGLVLGARRPIPALAGVTLVLIAGIGASVLKHWYSGFWLNPWPVAAGDFAFAFTVLSWKFQTEWKERERLAAAVENSMSKDMVQLIRIGMLNVTRFGERREITILFSDLSGFTTIAEKMDPGELVRLLNYYLDEAVGLIFKYNGYVDKFIGDAVMALWNAPVIGQDSHAKLALQAAIGFEDAVGRFNQTAMREFKIDKPIFTARVGLHTGDAIVGNIGSKDRHNYTAIGDSVNLASRLESLGKQYDCLLLISEDAVKSAGAEDMQGLVEVDTVSVKGRTTPTRIFTYVRPEHSVSIVKYKNALENYRKEKWDEALDGFESATGVPSWEIMAERCRVALASGTPEAFKNGVWIHDSK